jgi:copper chaperone CopZ
VTRTRTAILSIENLTADVFPALTQALKKVPGVESVSFSLERSVASVDFDPSQSSIDDLLRAVLKAGCKLL